MWKRIVQAVPKGQATHPEFFICATRALAISAPAYLP